MPEPENSDTPRHVSAEKSLPREANLAAARFEASQQPGDPQLVQLPVVRWPPPESVLLTTCEALTWIALGFAIREMEAAEKYAVLSVRWGVSPGFFRGLLGTLAEAKMRERE